METVVGSGRTAGFSLTRPSDTNAYTAGDVISNSTLIPVTIAIPSVGASSRGFTILQSALIIDSAAVATPPDLELWLFDTTVTTPNDNAAFAPTDAELLTLVTVIEFPTADFKLGIPTANAAGNCICEANNLGVPINIGAAAGTLFGVLVVRNNYVPVSAEVFTVKLKLLD